MDKEFETKEDMNIKENKEIINDKETTDESLDNTNETKKDYIKKEDTTSTDKDDNEDEYLLQLIGYGVAGMSFEERAEYNPMDFFNQIKSPSAAIAPVENFINLVKLLDPFSIENNWDDEEIKKGPYKEMTKWQRTLIKSVPGLRGIWESKDIRTKWEYLDSQLDKTTNSND